ncbi:hypothetical protein FVE85_3202 [Porphyridium purpureum]|uniref:BZIP domain-containing protein n=1 Tax=Porphyridium purpureum TaxID=35688 RepID=A0A5J4YTX2_PORPP|nr:hypothetical protein FVE85_3202 [Porphyridium purpureum]|eukprot:POR5029..scf227_4
MDDGGMEAFDIMDDFQMDVETMGLPELLNEINPALMDDMRSETPQVLSALLEQDFHFNSSGSVLATREPSLGRDASRTSDLNSSPAPAFQTVPSAGRLPGILTTPRQGQPSAMLPPTPTGTATFAIPESTWSGNAGPASKKRPKQTALQAPARSPVVAQRRIGGPKQEAFTASHEPAEGPQAYVPPSGQEDGEGDSDEDDDDARVGKKGPRADTGRRAERNRQSAAASRERKKQHITELERRVSMLSAENAQLQVEQLNALRKRLNNERQLLEENKNLKKQLVIRDMKIEKLSKKLTDAGISEAEGLKRPSTWAGSEWGQKK